MSAISSSWRIPAHGADVQLHRTLRRDHVPGNPSTENVQRDGRPARATDRRHPRSGPPRARRTAPATGASPGSRSARARAGSCAPTRPCCVTESHSAPLWPMPRSSRVGSPINIRSRPSRTPDESSALAPRGVDLLRRRDDKRDVCQRRGIRCGDVPQRHRHRGEGALHVARAPPVRAASFYRPGKRWAGPARRVGRHGVDVAT